MTVLVWPLMSQLRRRIFPIDDEEDFSNQIAVMTASDSELEDQKVGEITRAMS